MDMPLRPISLFFVLLVLGQNLSVYARHWPEKHPRNEKKLELPKPTRFDIVINHSAYTVSFNPSTLVANWVAYELTADETDGPWSRKGLRFMPDPDCHERQADHDDYRNSGYSRGHLAPAGDMKWDNLAMVESFYFTNCIPQETKFNNGKWNQLEEKTRRWAKQYGKVYIVCGPAYLNEDTLRIGHNGVAVPDACFKALLVPKKGDYSAIAFLMRNGGEERPLMDCACTVDELEELLSMDFFCNFPDRIENNVESVVVMEDWFSNR
jgi:endonuclease G